MPISFGPSVTSPLGFRTGCRVVLIPSTASLGLDDSGEFTTHPSLIESTVFPLKFLKSAVLSEPSRAFSCCSTTTGQSTCGIPATLIDWADAEGMKRTDITISKARYFMEPPDEE